MGTTYVVYQKGRTTGAHNDHETTKQLTQLITWPFIKIIHYPQWCRDRVSTHFGGKLYDFNVR